jgi:dihydrofolate reductase
MIIGIVAVAENLAIGKDGKLPWHYSADLKFFKKTTTGNVVVMGSNTWGSIRRPLPDRLNIVLSRRSPPAPQPGVIAASGREDALAMVPYLNCDVFIIGGAKTYEAFSDDIQRWIVTRVPVVVDDPDVSMPAGFLDDFDPDGTVELGEGLRVEYYNRRS